MDYKSTLLLPNTDFEMKGNLVAKDKAFLLNNWSDKLNHDRDLKYVIHDGPPYANGPIHVGHALNKILKDIIYRNKRLEGYDVDWRPGWDTHGLPIEIQVQKKGVKKTDPDYLRKCEEFALQQVANQEEQFKSLVISTDFKNKYVTLTNDYVSKEVEIFHKLYNAGHIEKGLRPIYWSWSSQTALAETEIEYADVESDSIYVLFKLANKWNDEDLYFVVWTTTPWTLTVNQAIAFGKEIEYVVTEFNGKKIVIAKNLINQLSEVLELNSPLKQIDTFNPENFIGRENNVAINPIDKNKKSILVWGHHVSDTAGTGIVHIAGAHGADDFKVANDNSLKEIINAINENGIMNEESGFGGEFYLKANPIIIEQINANNNLVKSNKITHSHPIDWRTKKQVVNRITSQWYFMMNDTVKSNVSPSINNINWLPSWTKDRITSMFLDRGNWCISRQRKWGVPIMVLYDGDKAIQFTDGQLNKINTKIENEGMNWWTELSVEEIMTLLDIKIDKPRKETDTLDVWFDSGSSRVAVIGDKDVDLYLEGNDQFRGWYQSSIIISSLIKIIDSNKLSKSYPTKEIITHGFVTDKNGEKMSKSKGNVEDPLKILNKFGSDVLKLWVASSDYSDNIRISDDILNQVSTDYRKIRNTFKFILGNLYDINDEIKNKDFIVKNKDEYVVLFSIYENINYEFNKVKEYYEAKNFIEITKLINKELSSGSIAYLLDYAKDVLYVYPKNDLNRRMIQSLLVQIIDFLLYALGPIIPVTAQELFENCNKTYGFSSEENLFNHIFDLNKVGSQENWILFDEVKREVNKTIENLREEKIVKRSQEVEISLVLPINNWYNYINNFETLLMVAKVNIETGEQLRATGKVFEGQKCERCWKHFVKLVEGKDICEKCNKAINDK